MAIQSNSGLRSKTDPEAPQHSARLGENTLKTLDHALSLLELLAEERHELGISELSRRLGISKTAVHRIASTLHRRGLLHKSAEAHRYALGIKLWEIGCQAMGRLGIRELAFPHLEDLWRQTGETVYLATYDAGEVVWVEKIDGPKPVRVYAKLGGRAPVHAVSCGKAILAHLSARELEPILANLRPATQTTIVDPGALLAELQMIRRQGYAISRGEWDPTVVGLAAPVRDRRRRVVASVGISAPASYVSPTFEQDVAPLLAEKAEAISVALGYLPSLLPGDPP